MKKLLALFLVFVMVFSVAALFAACENNDTTSQNNDDGKKPADPTDPPVDPNEPVTVSVLTKVFCPALELTNREYTYNEQGQLIKEVRYEHGQISETFVYSYLPDGTLSQTIRYWGEDQEHYRKTYVYDQTGNLQEDLCVFTVDGTQERNVYTYDDKGNMTAQTMYHNEELFLSSTFAYTYDANGRPIQMITYYQDTEDGRTLYTYDAAGNLTAEIHCWGETEIYRETYSYNEKGNLTKYAKISSEGEEILRDEYVYDANGNITEATHHRGEYQITHAYEYISVQTTRGEAENLQKPFVFPYELQDEK